jgi:hypothetical protein
MDTFQDPIFSPFQKELSNTDNTVDWDQSLVSIPQNIETLDNLNIGTGHVIYSVCDVKSQQK